MRALVLVALAVLVLAGSASAWGTSSPYWPPTDHAANKVPKAIHPDLGPTTVVYNSSVDGWALSYLEWLPENFHEGSTYPLAIFLHGAGTVSTWVIGGTGGISVPGGVVSAASSSQFILISINTRSSDGFYSNTPCGGPQAQDVLDAIANENSTHHIGSLYLIGFSMGSVGAFTLAADHPGMFTGIATAGTITDAFETQFYNAATHGTNPGWTATQCGASLLKGNTTAIAFAYHLSPLRFYPQNYSGVKVYMVGGGLDVHAPNNFSIWAYANVNNTARNSTCVTTLYEPANCTATLGFLHNRSPLLYAYLDLYEPKAPHVATQFYGPSVFQFFMGTISGGLYHAAYPPTKIFPGP